MPYTIQREEHHLVLELKGGVTARDVADLAKSLATSLNTATAVVVRSSELEDTDTSVLQLLVSVRKTVPAFAVEDSSEPFANAVDRCSLRRELLAPDKEGL